VRVFGEKRYKEYVERTTIDWKDLP